MSVADLTSQLHRYSVDEYNELVRAGVFEDQRVELIEGLILDMSPKSPAHENAIEWLNHWFVRRIDDSRYHVRVQSSVRLARSQPEPDLAVVDRDRRRNQHPLAAHLVIEVALSSRERDLTIKPRLYADIAPEYWVLDLEHRHMVVHRDPGESGYRDVSIHGRDSWLAPSSLELEPMAVAELLDWLE